MITDLGLISQGVKRRNIVERAILVFKVVVCDLAYEWYGLGLPTDEIQEMVDQIERMISKKSTFLENRWQQLQKDLDGDETKINALIAKITDRLNKEVPLMAKSIRNSCICLSLIISSLIAMPILHITLSPTGATTINLFFLIGSIANFWNLYSIISIQQYKMREKGRHILKSTPDILEFIKIEKETLC